jgi:hypothetical protein
MSYYSLDFGTTIPADIGFRREPETLMDRLKLEVWPLRYRLKKFNSNPTLVELRLTHNDTFQHRIAKVVHNHGKNHCALCYEGQTTYGCNLCKVILCKNVREGKGQSCFSIWHSKVDLLHERQRLRALPTEEGTTNMATADHNDQDATTADRNDETSSQVSNSSLKKKRKGSNCTQIKVEVRKRKKPLKGSKTSTVNETTIAQLCQRNDVGESLPSNHNGSSKTSNAEGTKQQNQDLVENISHEDDEKVTQEAIGIF